MSCIDYLGVLEWEFASAAVMKTDQHLEMITVGDLSQGRRGSPWGAAAEYTVFAHLGYISTWGGLVVFIWFPRATGKL